MIRFTRGTRALTGAALLLLTTVAPVIAGPGKNDKTICENVQAPADTKLVFQAYAQGVQIYRWNGASWSFVAPAAVLYADADGNGAMGIHYGGPTWQSASGSKVVAAVVERCTADPNSIQWFLLGAVSSEGPGIFEGVTHIQRVNTVGGLAPATPGSFIGEVVNIAYSAEYFFYRTK
jgi:hypothetical protein